MSQKQTSPERKEVSGSWGDGSTPCNVEFAATAAPDFDAGTFVRCADQRLKDPHCRGLSLTRAQAAQLAESIREMVSENERVSGAVCSGILRDLLTPDESEALVAFVKALRAEQSA